MRILKKWSLFNSVESVLEGHITLEYRKIEKICDKFGIENWSLEGGLVNVDGDVDLYDKELTHIPLKFGKVTGDFKCSNNNLTSLEGCPVRVGGGFDCGNNKLTSLVGCPKSVGRRLWCHNNYIREFTGIKYIDLTLNCSGNPIGNIWRIISPDWKWDEEHMDLFEDISVIQDDGEAVAIDRLNFFLEEIGLPTVDGVDGYINI